MEGMEDITGIIDAPRPPRVAAQVGYESCHARAALRLARPVPRDGARRVCERPAGAASAASGARASRDGALRGGARMGAECSQPDRSEPDLLLAPEGADGSRDRRALPQ